MGEQKLDVALKQTGTMYLEWTLLALLADLDTCLSGPHCDRVPNSTRYRPSRWGETALSWQGVRHNIAFREKVVLWGQKAYRIPSWVDEHLS